jgi:hypothetical protein
LLAHFKKLPAFKPAYMTRNDAVKASSLKDLIRTAVRKTSSGLAPLGYLSVLSIRDKFSKRIAVYYQSIA